MRLDSVYVTYWSLRDPLCQSQSLPVVRALAARGWRMGLVTYEQAPWALATAEKAAVAEGLRRDGIRWMPLPYHRRPAVLSTLYDIARGFGRCRSLAPRLLHGRGTVPTAIAYAASRGGRSLCFVDADGPLSQEYVDAGVWAAGSLPHRLTQWSEGRCLSGGDAVAVLTEVRRLEILGFARPPVEVLPCGVDTALFAPDAPARERLRRELGLEGLTLAYAGKSGGWYRTDAMLDFAAACQRRQAPVTLLVLTTEDAERFVAPARERGLRCVVRRSRREEMPAYLSAADAGLSFRMEAPSQRACSPIKNGEYLSCGLPVISSPGVGDYSALLERLRVGVVVDPEGPAGFAAGVDRLRGLLADPSLATRCREAACSEVDLQQVVIPRYVSIYTRLLGPPTDRESAPFEGAL